MMTEEERVQAERRSAKTRSGEFRAWGKENFPDTSMWFLPATAVAPECALYSVVVFQSTIICVPVRGRASSLGRVMCLFRSE
jgi:hypothetical protein